METVNHQIKVNTSQLIQIIGSKEIELQLCRDRIIELSKLVQELQNKEKETHKIRKFEGV
jgi:hypothetical protein